MNSINNRLQPCIFCGQIDSSRNSKSYSASATKSNQVIDLVFKKICYSLHTGSASELCIQDLFALSTVNKSFMEKSKNIWKLIMKGFTSEEDRTIFSNIQKLPLIDLMKSTFQIDKF